MRAIVLLRLVLMAKHPAALFATGVTAKGTSRGSVPRCILTLKAPTPKVAEAGSRRAGAKAKNGIPKAAAKVTAEDGRARALQALKQPNSNTNLLYLGPANP